MIRMIQSSSSRQAKTYFSDALSRSDYYMEDQEIKGTLNGKLVERLGLSQDVTKEAFFSLCDNRHPETGKRLTPHSKEGRTVGYDINFHCPKSVSIASFLAGDDHIIDAFKESVNESMLEIEADAKVRVRTGGKDEERKTGELLWADFIHHTARPVEGQTGDPHLHAHCFVMNCSFDQVENKLKAGQFREINANMPYYQARFHKRLSDKLAALGYKTRATRNSFEIEGIGKHVIDHFSKRTDEIGRVAKEKNITNQGELAALGAKTRAKKQKGLSMSDLKADWIRQIKELEAERAMHIPQEQLNAEKEIVVRNKIPQQKNDMTAQECLDFAIAHHFERASVVDEKTLLKTAVHHSIGGSMTLNEIQSCYDKQSHIMKITDNDRIVCTTFEVLEEEKQMIELARASRGKFKPFYESAPELDLQGQQESAVKHVLTTKNGISIIRGAAGAGKTTLMQKAVTAIEATGKTVTVVAPTSYASRDVLKNEGFKDAQTVARLLIDTDLQSTLKDQVLWVDEAGLLGTKDMLGLIKLCDNQNARLILGGDTRQHSSITRGDALRILNTVGKIPTAEVSKIYRQKNENYRDAVNDLSKGNIKSGFEKLDALEFIKESDPSNANEQLIDNYIKSVDAGKNTLIICPTHAGANRLTHELREKLKSKGKLGKKEKMVHRLENRNLTEAEKSDWRQYKQGQTIEFHQNIKGAKRASRWKVHSVEDKNIVIINEQQETLKLPQEKTSQFSVYEESEIALAKGDKIRITQNTYDENRKRIDNGTQLEVKGISPEGKLLLRGQSGKTNYQLDKNFGHIAYAHVITSHASQGKTVDEIFISQPSMSFGATDAKQFYVSVSRARETAHIYTDDKSRLLEHVARIGDRTSAIELVSSSETHKHHIAILEKSKYAVVPPHIENKKDIFYKPSIDLDYEPEA